MSPLSHWPHGENHGEQATCEPWIERINGTRQMWIFHGKQCSYAMCLWPGRTGWLWWIISWWSGNGKHSMLLMHCQPGNYWQVMTVDRCHLYQREWDFWLTGDCLYNEINDWKDILLMWRFVTLISALAADAKAGDENSPGSAGFCSQQNVRNQEVLFNSCILPFGVGIAGFDFIWVIPHSVIW